MALVKIICPKCQKVYTIDPSVTKQVCPICGAPLFEGSELDIPNLEEPKNISSLSDALNYGFKLLYFRSYDRLLKFSKIMLEKYPNNYWSVLFELIGKSNLDFIFLLPKIDYTLTDEEIKEDARSRYYHYARKKYQKSPQSTFNKIAGFYPDIPSNKRNKWNKARTKYEEKLEEVNRYVSLTNLIREEYLERLDSLAISDDQKHINHNIKVWMDQVSHAQIDLYRYNQSIDNYVKEDYEETPNPGNKPVFLGYLSLYIIAFLTFVLSAVQIILTIINKEWMSRPVLYIIASISTVLILSASTLFLINRQIFRRLPVIGVAIMVTLLAICGAGIATAGVNSIVSWFAIFSVVIALVALFYTSVKIVKNLPRKTENGTIIGDLAKLSDHSFEVTYVFAFKLYQGEELDEITFSEDWLYEQE